MTNPTSNNQRITRPSLRHLAPLIPLLVLLPACTTTATSPHAAITNLLDQQAAAWNRGDIEGFMSVYWQSPELTFSSGGETRRGWQATRDHFAQRYDSPAKMGTLTFDELETYELGLDAALVLGRWQLDRSAGPLGGNFSLVLRRIDGAWRIVHDHSSVTTVE